MKKMTLMCYLYTTIARRVALIPNEESKTSIPVDSDVVRFVRVSERLSDSLIDSKRAAEGEEKEGCARVLPLPGAPD